MLDVLCKVISFKLHFSCVPHDPLVHKYAQKVNSIAITESIKNNEDRFTFHLITIQIIHSLIFLFHHLLLTQIKLKVNTCSLNLSSILNSSVI